MGDAVNDHSPAFNYISLCTGGGGLDLGFERAVRNARCVAAVEIESYARAVLAARMEEDSMVAAPLYSDIASFSGRPFHRLVDAVIGGTPCTDLSVAGRQAGLDGPKSKLFFEMCRIVAECQPGWFLWENVGGAKKVLPRVFKEFENLGYFGKCVSIRASDVGAPHQRARFFVLGRRMADAAAAGLQGSSGRGLQQLESPACDGAMADANGAVIRNESGRSSGAHWSSQTESSDSGSCVADPARDGRDERWSESDAERQTCADESGPELANGDGGRLAPVGPAHDDYERDASGHVDDGRGAEVADASDAGLQGSERSGASCEGARAPRPVAERGRSLWPPGPDGDWSGVPARFFPAQRFVRGVDDGMAGKLDQSIWADRLRMLGNGVCIAQAEEAIRFLYENFE